MTARIKRTFSDISDEALNDIERAQFFGQMDLPGTLAWDDVLKSPRVIIISEAGSGKTYECQQEQRRLWGQGEAAFFVELAQMGAGNLGDLLSPAEFERFEAWRISQSGIATFFLDSVDELKLTQGSFRTALTRLGKSLAQNLGRVHIVITARPIPFDEAEFRQTLPFPEPSQIPDIPLEQSFAEIAMGRSGSKQSTQQADDAPTWRRVHLMPFSNENIREMINNQGVVNPDELMAAIRQKNAEDFARRPLDLIELCADWRNFGRIRTHREQLEYNIQVKLKPRSDRNELTELSPEQALNGASRLALACLLSKKLVLRHSAESDKVAAAEGALDPATILDDWTEKNCRTLLERALFGIANYGRVRFHHRSVIEFLAAQHLQALLDRGMAIKPLKRLLFAETPQGIKVVRPSMRPIAAWLARSNPTVFSEILEREPDVLLDFADPESLSPSQRGAALRAYVKHYGSGSWRGMHVPRIQIQRFANEELAAVTGELWDSGIENPEVRQLLIEMMGAGNMRECADRVLVVALDDSAGLYERREALEALRQLEDSRIPSVIDDMLSQPEKWPELLLKAGLLSFFPTHLPIEKLGAIVERVSESRDEIGRVSWHWPRIIAECDIASEYLEALREKLTQLVMQGATCKYTRFKTSRPDLVNALAAVCLRQFLQGCRSRNYFESVVAVVHFSQDEYVIEKELATELQKKLAELQNPFRENLFWIEVAFIRKFQPEADIWNVLNAVRFSILQLNVQHDSDWLLKNLADPSLAHLERWLVLELFIDLTWDRQTEVGQQVRYLQPLVADSQKLSETLDSYLQPRRENPELERIKKRNHQSEEQRKQREAENIASWITFWRNVSENQDTAFGQERIEATAWNLWNAARRSAYDNASGWNRRFIELHFSKEVADRFRQALMVFWRLDTPTLRSERPVAERNTTPYRWLMGLTGIYAESEDPEWAKKLSYEEALRAARYALIQFNDLPAWLASLTAAYPDAVKSILAAELASELEECAESGAHYKVLQSLRDQPLSFIQLFTPQLRLWLDTAHLFDENRALERLKLVLNILLMYEDDAVRVEIMEKAEGAVKVGLNTPFATVWLAALLMVSPARGVAALVDGLAGRENDETKLGEMLIGELFAARHQKSLIDLSLIDFTPEQLFELVQLAYKHVRPADDISHKGVFTPGTRDHAEEGREVLLSSVLNLSSSEGWAIKLRMADDPLFSHFRDRALVLAKEKAAQEIDTRIYAPAEIIALFKTGEAPPATRDELFELMLNRLDDLEELLLRDDSPREAWAGISAERIMRREIARVLGSKTNGVYSVDQEGVTADEKETDIRLRVAQYDLQGVIELKLGDGRSGRDLKDTLQNQIVAKYMAPENRRAGFLLVTVAKERNWDHPETAEKLDMNGLRTMLEVEAEKIMREMGGVLKLGVKVLDLRPRLPKENK